MNIPRCRVFCVGEVTSWGKTFLGNLQSANLIEVSFEPLQQHLTSLSVPTQPQVLFVENTPDARQTVEVLRASNRHFFLIWFGKTFSKEEYAYAITARVYAMFENAKADDKRIISTIQKLSINMEASESFEHLIRSLKAVLLQAEADDNSKPLVGEIKAAVTKLEKCNLHNELHSPQSVAQSGPDASLPFYKTQGFGEALITVHDLERTGVLFIRGNAEGQEGKVEFIQGKIVSAIVGDVHGSKALYRMFLWDEPRFLFTRRDPQDTQVDEPMRESLKHLCLEGEAFRRRFEKIRRELPPADLRLTLEPNALHVGTKLNDEDFHALSSVIEFETVSQIVDYNPLPDVSLYESLIRLKKTGMIKVAPA